LELALDNKVDDKTRHILDRAQEASTSLTDVMEDLLKLTKSEDNPIRSSNETFNLSLTSKLFIDVWKIVLTSISLKSNEGVAKGGDSKRSRVEYIGKRTATDYGKRRS
jgi:signal transduction histidine kinase